MHNKMVNTIREVVTSFEQLISGDDRGLDCCNNIRDPEFVKCIQDLQIATEREFSWRHRDDNRSTIEDLFEMVTS